MLTFLTSYNGIFKQAKLVTDMDIWRQKHIGMRSHFNTTLKFLTNFYIALSDATFGNIALVYDVNLSGIYIIQYISIY